MYSLNEYRAFAAEVLEVVEYEQVDDIRELILLGLEQQKEIGIERGINTPYSAEIDTNVIVVKQLLIEIIYANGNIDKQYVETQLYMRDDVSMLNSFDSSESGLNSTAHNNVGVRIDAYYTVRRNTNIAILNQVRFDRMCTTILNQVNSSTPPVSIESRYYHEGENIIGYEVASLNQQSKVQTVTLYSKNSGFYVSCDDFFCWKAIAYVKLLGGNVYC